MKPVYDARNEAAEEKATAARNFVDFLLIDDCDSHSFTYFLKVEKTYAVRFCACKYSRTPKKLIIGESL